ncbi:hypothetical protein Tco_0370525 [Tanacetum coccineum]
MAPCTSCSLGKLIARPSPLKVEKESPVFLERIQGDIYHTIKRVRLDNAGEFTSQAFNDYSHFADCHFNEAIFPSLGEEKKNHEKDVSYSEPSLLYLDPRTKQSETEVQRIIHIQVIANQLPNAFTDTKRVTKSYIQAVNAPARVEIPDIESDEKVTQESKARLKRGRPVGSKDKNPRKRKAIENAIIHEDIVLEGTQNVAPLEEEINDINKEISILWSL